MRRHVIGVLGVAWALAHGFTAKAAPVITSPPPASGAAPATAIVFTFSEAMDTNATSAYFIDGTTFASLPTTDVWSAGDTVLTCTPTPAFPANRMIFWSVDGQNLLGDPLDGTTGGFFTTGSGTGTGTGGSGTNAITVFSVGKVHHYNQTSAGAPALDPATPYGFAGVTTLASNRTAVSVTLTIPTVPTASVSNLIHLPPPQAEKFLLSVTSANLAAYDANFPAGNYSFFVQAAASNQTVVVNLPSTATLPQPGAPHLTNFPAAQAVDASRAFVLGWDAFPGGTTADYIDVDIGTVYLSPEPGWPGALNGTARTFTIPAGTLQPNTTYLSRVGFFHFVGTTNAGYSADAFRTTYTEFSLITTPSGSLVLTNPAWSPTGFSFNVLCATGQTVTVEYSNRLTGGPWTSLLTTQSTGSRFHVVSPQATSAPALFYRARTGP